MKKLVIINSTVNSGSTGKISEQIGLKAINSGFDCWIAYGIYANNSQLHTLKIGNRIDILLHVIQTRIFDNHGFASYFPTRRLIKNLRKINPDIVNLHNIHGYYININVLIKYLSKNKIPVVWTFHDCWPMTGHCTFFDRYECVKWKTQCFECPNQNGYPKSILIDNSKRNFLAKKVIICKIENLTVVTPSSWMRNIVKQSFLKMIRVKLIYNGIDLNTFRPISSEKIRNKYNLGKKHVVLGVASIWDERKGLNDFFKIRALLSTIDIEFILVGLNKSQVLNLPPGIMGILRTESLVELVELYSIASVFVNPTYIDNFPTTNIEALACGTPVITYDTGGSPEAIDDTTGFVIQKGDINLLASCINLVINNGKDKYEINCRERAKAFFNMDDRYNDYIQLFNEILSKNECIIRP